MNLPIWLRRSPKTTALIIGAVAVIALAAHFGLRGTWECRDGTWNKIGYPLRGQPKTVCPASPVTAAKTQLCSPPWSCGKLAWGEAGMKRDTWYLKFEDVSGPAKLEIVFEPNAVCRVDMATADCAQVFPPNDTASTFSGYREGDVFRISELNFTLPPRR